MSLWGGAFNTSATAWSSGLFCSSPGVYLYQLELRVLVSSHGLCLVFVVVVLVCVCVCPLGLLGVHFCELSMCINKCIGPKEEDTGHCQLTQNSLVVSFCEQTLLLLSTKQPMKSVPLVLSPPRHHTQAAVAHSSWLLATCLYFSA